MKTKHLLAAVIIPATLLSPIASAVEVYKSEQTSVSMLGWYRPTFISGGGVDELVDGTSRIGFSLSQQLPGDWTATGRIEWGVSLLNNNQGINVTSGDGNRNTVGTTEDSDSLWTRLGYVSFDHDKYGNITLGKNWSVYYDLSKITDGFEMVGGEASGTYNFGSDGGFSGVGRAEQAIQYRNSFGDFDLGLQFQATDESISFTDQFGNSEGTGKFDNGYGVTLAYNAPADFRIAAAFNRAKIEIEDLEGNREKLDDQIWGAGISYGQLWQPGLYAAVLYTESENHEIDDAGVLFDAKGLEAIVEYRFDNNVSVYGGYNNLQENDSDYGDALDQQYELEYGILGAKYYWTEDVVVFTEYKMDKGTSFNGEERDDLFGIGVRYMFY